MTQAVTGNTVRVHYTGRLSDNSVFDSSVTRDPLEFTLGEGVVIPGFDSAICGMTIGEEKTVTIDVDNAYGGHREDLVMTVGLDQFPPEMGPEIGKRVQVQSPQGALFTMEITGFTDTTVTLDANHPLAGKELTFDIELIEIITV